MRRSIRSSYAQFETLLGVTYCSDYEELHVSPECLDLTHSVHTGILEGVKGEVLGV